MNDRNEPVCVRETIPSKKVTIANALEHHRDQITELNQAVSALADRMEPFLGPDSTDAKDVAWDKDADNSEVNSLIRSMTHDLHRITLRIGVLLGRIDL